MFEIYEVTFEVYIGNELINRQVMQAPKEMLIANFLNTAKQIKNDNRPIKLKMIVPDIFWDEFENKQKILNNCVEVINQAMEVWQNDNRRNQENN